MNNLPTYLEGLGAVARHPDQPAHIAHFGSPVDEYHAACTGSALSAQPERGILRVNGADRQPWLHNLVTNEVSNLQTGEGNYAFALNVRGRILFDVNIIVRSTDILLDIDRRWLTTAAQHMDKYIIMEDVALEDASNELVVLGVCGADLPRLTADLGAPPKMAQLDHRPVSVGACDITAVCHDFCGIAGMQFIVPAHAAAKVWSELVARGFRPVGADALDILRIEHGIPAALTDLNDDILPAETGQLERAVSFNKGCYLGQEVVERMRAHRSVAKQLVGLLFEAAPPPGAALQLDDQVIGRVTSVGHSIKLDRPIGLGYIKTAAARSTAPLVVTTDDSTIPCTVHGLPF